MTVERSDLVLFQQTRDALGQALHYLAFARLHTRHVHAGLCVDAVLLGMPLDELKMMGGVEQGLGRNTPDIETGAAELQFARCIGPALDTGSFESQLRSADRGDITARPAANHYDVIVVHGHS